MKEGTALAWGFSAREVSLILPIRSGDNTDRPRSPEVHRGFVQGPMRAGLILYPCGPPKEVPFPKALQLVRLPFPGPTILTGGRIREIPSIKKRINDARQKRFPRGHPPENVKMRYARGVLQASKGQRGCNWGRLTRKVGVPEGLTEGTRGEIIVGAERKLKGSKGKA